LAKNYTRFAKMRLSFTKDLKNKQTNPEGVSVDEEIELSQITLFPNPSKNFITINGLAHEVEVSLFDIKGRLVLNQKISPFNNIVGIS